VTVEDFILVFWILGFGLWLIIIVEFFAAVHWIKRIARHSARIVQILEAQYGAATTSAVPSSRSQPAYHLFHFKNQGPK